MSGNRITSNSVSSSSSSRSEENVTRTRGRKRRSGVEDGLISRNQGPEMLINELKTVYFIPDEVAARFEGMGVVHAGKMIETRTDEEELLLMDLVEWVHHSGAGPEDPIFSRYS
jgi:hypothetical protein